MFRASIKRLLVSMVLLGATVPMIGAAAVPDARNRCGITQMTESFIQAHPDAEGPMQAAQLQLENEARAMRASSSTQALAAPMIIPVVVHIIHKNGPENIPDSKVIEGVEQVNQDFKMLNASSSLIHPNFRGLVTDSQMIFRLAKRDPNGSPTTGITRTVNSAWSSNGGADESNMKRTLGWPQNKYLNVYVVESAYGGSSSAYAHYPSSVQPPYEHYDGIIISAWAYGRTTPGYYTILSHEIGHWANLIHTWGEGEVGLSSNCSTDDLVSDTPNCAGAYGTRCGINTNTCGNTDNNENFMDYGQCAMMFTAGQVARMHAAMNSSIGRRNEIWQQANLIATGVYEGNYLPTAKANGEYYGSSGASVSFSSAGSYDTDGSISSYSWSFGDGTSGSGASTTHVYTTPGTYTVTLTVTDNGGGSASETTRAYITAPGTYISAESEPNDNFASADGPVGSTVFPVTGSFAPLESDYYYFNITRAGKISINLKATSSTATVTWLLYHESNQSQYVAYPTQGGSESIGEFDATQTGRYYLATYTSTNTQTGYTLNVRYPGSAGTAPVCNYTISPTSASYAASGGSGSVSVSAGTSCSWTATSNVSWITVTSGASGTANGTVGYSVAANSTTSSRTGTLTIAGRTFTVTQSAGSTTNPPPVANFTFTTSGLTATFTDTSTDSNGTIASRSWNFGDGTTSTATNPSKTYGAAGTYTVTLTVTDNGGATNSTSKSVTVSTTTPPSNSLQNGVPKTGLSAATGASLNFTMDVPAGATNLRFVMSGGTGDADLYVRFGSPPTTSTYDCRPFASTNNETCNIATAQAGRYYVMIRADAAFSGVSLTGSYTAGTGNTPPVANFSFTTSGLTASFTDSSTDSNGTIASRSWNFGDGTTSTATNPSKTYAAAGTYTVTLTVTDNGGATNSTSKSVTVSSTTPPPTLPECTASDTRQLGKNCKRSNRSKTSGNYDYMYILMPSGVSQLKITVSGGTGNANLYVSTSTWATQSNYQYSSTNSGNSETLTIVSPPSGYLYISLHAASAFSGVTVATEY